MTKLQMQRRDKSRQRIIADITFNDLLQIGRELNVSPELAGKVPNWYIPHFIDHATFEIPTERVAAFIGRQLMYIGYLPNRPMSIEFFLRCALALPGEDSPTPCLFGLVIIPTEVDEPKPHIQLQVFAAILTEAERADLEINAYILKPEDVERDEADNENLAGTV